MPRRPAPRVFTYDWADFVADVILVTLIAWLVMLAVGAATSLDWSYGLTCLLLVIVKVLRNWMRS